MYIDLKLLSGIFEKLQSSGIAKIINELQNKVNRLEPNVWEEYYRTYFSVLDSIIVSLQTSGILSEDCYKKVASLRMEAESIIKQNFSVEVGTFLATDYSHIKALHHLGVISWYESEGKFTFFFSPSLTIPMLGYISGMDEKSLKQHIKSIEKIRRPELSNEDLNQVVNEAFVYVSAFVEAFKKILIEHAKTILNLDISSDTLEAVASIELLPTSTDFYLAGIKYYQLEFEKEIPTHFTFATTSGIIMPQEHFGTRYFTEILPVQELADTVNKNPIRERYFDIVRSSQERKPRAYYFEFKRTADTLKKTYNKIRAIDSIKAESYLKDAVKILEQYLQLPKFSLIKVDEFPNEFNYLTLGNEQNVLLSMRDETQKIAHGLWIKPKGSLLMQVLRNIKWEEIQILLLQTVGTGIGGYITNALSENLIVAFAAAFAPSLFFGVQKIRGTNEARDAIFDIGKRISDKKLNIEIIKDFDKKPKIEAEKLIQQLL